MKLVSYYPSWVDGCQEPVSRAPMKMMTTPTRVALRAAEVDARSGLVSLLWADGLRRIFHPLWLRDNDPGRRHPGTRQRLHSAADLPHALCAATAEASTDALRVRWVPEHTSSFCASWLRGHGSDASHVGDASPHLRDQAQAAVREAQEAARALPPPAVPMFDFEELRGSDDEARWRWLGALAEEGATLVRGVPAQVAQATQASGGAATEVDGVRFIAELIGPMQPNIYGSIFDVISKGDAAENLAYTSEEIGPHMDLCYYESPPGLPPPWP